MKQLPKVLAALDVGSRELVVALKLASLCGHGTGLARFAESLLRYYPKEIEPCFK